MLPESTRYHRQREAFALLRTKAARAHGDGDGLLVSSLSATALQEISNLIVQGTLLLTFRELQWAIIFQMIWLLHKQSIVTTFQLIQKWPCSTDDDREIQKLLKNYIKLLSEPLQGVNEAVQIIETVSLPAFGEQSTPETKELVQHFIELIWFQTVSYGQWKSVLEKWIASGPEWMKKDLSTLRERLQIQAQLTASNPENVRLEENVAPILEGKLPLAGLWLLYLHGNRIEIEKMVTSQLARHNIEDYKWVLIADFGYTNSFTKEAAAWLARRRSIIPRFPILVFNQHRQLRINDLLLELLRTGEAAQGGLRQEIYLLAMFHELAALRIWDYWMWQEAICAESQVMLEASQWSGIDQNVLAVDGLAHGISGCFIKPQFRLVEQAIEKLEFADPALLKILGEAILATYSRQHHPAVPLVVEIADLLPEDLWSGLAEWTLKYAKNLREKRLLESKHNTLEHWLHLIPSLPETSSMWQSLHGEILLIARSGHSWLGDDKTLLIDWLIYAPLDLALDLGTTILSVSTPDLGLQLARARLLIQAEKGRPAFEHQLTRRLATEPQNVLIGATLATHLGVLSPDHAQVLRQDIERLTDVFLTQVLPPLDAQPSQVNTWVPCFDLVPSWTEADMPLLDKLISAVNSPAVLEPYIPSLLALIQLMAANGSSEIISKLVPEVVRWIDSHPTGRKSNQPNHAFSPIHFSSETPGIEYTLGWLIYQLVRKLDGQGWVLALAWTEKTLLSNTISHLPIAFQLNIIISTKTDPALAQKALHHLEAILFRLCVHTNDRREGAVGAVIDVLDYMAGALHANSSDLIDWSSTSGSAARQFLIEWCGQNLPQLSRDPDPNLRRAIGLFLCALQRQENISRRLSDILDRLKKDNRARVRLAASGEIH